ncbi:MAG: DedA family protein [Cyclobacteriaceae bacterium]|nr:DedA family protein [Cyclobacteriaceae bacterium]
MESFLEQYGYLALILGTFMEGEVAILVASSLIHLGLFQFPATVVVAFLGSFISDWVYYLIGRFNGKYFVAHRPALAARVEPVTQFFIRHKLQILFSYRFLYGFRIIIPLVVGMSGLRPMVYLVYSLVSGLVWATLVSTFGYWVGRLFELRAKSFEENFLLIVLGFGAFGLMVGYFIRRMATRKMKLSEPEH